MSENVYNLPLSFMISLLKIILYSLLHCQFIWGRMPLEMRDFLGTEERDKRRQCGDVAEGMTGEPAAALLIVSHRGMTRGLGSDKLLEFRNGCGFAKDDERVERVDTGLGVGIEDHFA